MWEVQSHLIRNLTADQERILKTKAMTILARYEKGVFRPLQEVQIQEGTVVEVNVPMEAATRKCAWRIDKTG